MAYPTKYTRQYDFFSYQTANPTRPLPGDKVNVDLNYVVSSIDEIVEFQKLIQRSDGALANGIVTVDALDPVLAAAFGDVGSLSEVQALIDAAAASASASASSASAAASSATSAAASASAAASSATSAAASATAAADAAASVAGAAGGGVPALVLSGASGVSVSDSDLTGLTTVYAVPAAGNTVPLYDGTKFSWAECVELSLALDSNSGHTGYHQSGKNYDVFVFDDSGTKRIGTGPAWSSDVSRGTGAGTTELTALKGILVNANAITLRFGSVSGNTVSVPANKATFIGSFRCTSNGQTEDSRSKRFVSNAYYPSTKPVRVIDTTDTWTYSTAAYRQANGSAANQFEYLHCLGGRPIKCEAIGFALNSTSTASGVRTGIGIDVTNADSSVLKHGANATNGNPFVFPRAYYSGNPGIGYHYVAWLEYGSGTADTQTWRGDNGGIGIYQLGVIGEVVN